MSYNISHIESHVQEEYAALSECNRKAKYWRITAYLSMAILLLIFVVIVLRLPYRADGLNLILVVSMFPVLGVAIFSIWRCFAWADRADYHSAFVPYLDDALRDAQKEETEEGGA